jgi:hypothetical protein
MSYLIWGRFWSNSEKQFNNSLAWKKYARKEMAAVNPHSILNSSPSGKPKFTACHSSFSGLSASCGDGGSIWVL